MWSLPVTWRSQHSICHFRKPHTTLNLLVIEAELLPTEVLHCAICYCDLDINLFIKYELGRYLVNVYRSTAGRQCFRKLSYYRQTQTDRHFTLPKFYAASQVVNCTYSFVHRRKDVTSEAWSNFIGGDLPVLVNWLQRHSFHLLHKLTAHLRTCIQWQQICKFDDQKGTRAELISCTVETSSQLTNTAINKLLTLVFAPGLHWQQVNTNNNPTLTFFSQSSRHRIIHPVQVWTTMGCRNWRFINVLFWRYHQCCVGSFVMTSLLWLKFAVQHCFGTYTVIHRVNGLSLNTAASLSFRITNITTSFAAAAFLRIWRRYFLRILCRQSSGGPDHPRSALLTASTDCRQLYSAERLQY